MRFTYNASDRAGRNMCRFSIGDTVIGSGPRPDNRNFSDDEIDRAIEVEGGYWQRAVAALYEILSTEWASRVDVSAGDQSYGRATPTVRFAELAREWRQRWGYLGTGGDPAGDRASNQLVGGGIRLGGIGHDPDRRW